jgi:tetratricopeptide (TPR) repeat protein
MTRTRLVVLLLSLPGVLVMGFMYARRNAEPRQAQEQLRSERKQDVGARGYADPASCATCHGEIARTYSLTGMARSFSRVRSAAPNAPNAPNAPLAPGQFFHQASGRHYAMLERGGALFQRRHEIGFDGKETNVVELEAGYVVGSGNHAQTFLHRKADGRLFQMPVSWYSERGGYWAMSPGYDRPAHLDFRRVINTDCMGCHNGYPRAAVQEDGNGPKFALPLPEGIDCQRCHGPGQAHVDAIKAGNLDAGRRAIANPANFDRARQLDTCMQCHLEPTSSPLPFQIRRYEHPPFSYTPGKPLGDHFLYFDHAPGSGRDDKFEIASGAYRLRKSACFQKSEMTCVTCHNPHDIPRGAKALQHYVAVCASCHEGIHRGGTPQTPGVTAAATCLDCHMPKRRAEDAVHTVMTDHYIQRRRPAVDLLAPRKESDNFEHGEYRGEVVSYYPVNPASTPDEELYLALAQVQQGSNLTTGITRLEQTIGKHKPARAEFYYELARAHVRTANYDAGVRWAEEALRRDPDFAPALKEIATAETAAGRLEQAAHALEKAAVIRPRDANALADLGNVYLQLRRFGDAQIALQKALALDSDLPRANNTMGLAALNAGTPETAERYFRESIRHQPDLAEGHNNLGNLLAGRKAYMEAAHHFERAIRDDPNYAAARHSYGLVLALSGSPDRAIVELRAAARLAPQSAEVHTDLADVLAATGRINEAAREYELGIRYSTDPQGREAAVEALRALRGAPR